MQNDHCQPAEIEQLLSDRLEPHTETQILKHIEGCDVCQATLEQQAATEETWHSARNFLADEEHDAILLSGLYDLSSSSSTGIHADESSVTGPVQSVLGILAPTDDPQMLGRLGPYEISGIVGAGGMGVVLKGHDLALDRVVAIKVLAPHLATSGAARKRFAREAKAAAAVLHPNVMSIHSVTNSGALPYLVMPYLRGSSLQKRIDLQGSLETVEILRVAGQIAAGLAAAHAQGLVHRDIKPANIMLADGLEQVAITDFGLARAVDDATMTRSGVIAGTPQYMSPEQARGEAIDARSDLFSLGSLMYAMCTGHPPFRAETSFGVLRRITDDQPRSIAQQNPQLPHWLCRLTERLHAKDPANRIQTAREVESLVSQCMAHLEQPLHNPLPVELRSTDKPRNFFADSAAWAKFATFLFVICLVVGFFALGPFGLPSWFNQDSPNDAQAPRNPASPGTQTANGNMPSPDAGQKNPSNIEPTSAFDELLQQTREDIDVLLEEIEPEIMVLEEFLNSDPFEELENNEN